MAAPPPDGPGGRGLVIAATACAAVVLASQLAGKAARDAIFLQQFAVTNLPLLLAISSALAIGATFVFARRLSRGVPVHVVRVTNAISAAMLVGEWLLIDHLPRPIAALVYMHQMLLGPILVSGFWSVMSECFDPRTARRVLGTVGTGATVGAVLGAVIAERVAALAGTNALLLAIAALQLIASWRLTVVARAAGTAWVPEPPPVREAAEHLTRLSLLRRLAAITVLVTVAAAFLDYLFKVVATESVQRPDDLARLFATFHGVVGVLTAVVQWLLGRWALQAFGLARTLATLPGAVIVFGIVAALAPGIGTFVALRGAENVLRNSLYREAYEVFYTPLLARERRATKTIIDVGVERFGDVLGGLAVLAMIAWATPTTSWLLAGAIMLSALGVIIALKAQQSYVEALERSLTAHAIELELDDGAAHDRTTRTTLELVAQRGAADSGSALAVVGDGPRGAGDSGSALAVVGDGPRGAGDSGSAPSAVAEGRRTGDSGASLPAGAEGRRSRWPFRGRRRRAGPARGALELSLSRLAELTSGDDRRIRRALAAHLLSPAGVAHTIPLLARPAVADAAQQALQAVAGACLGQLADAVRDPQLPVDARRKLPRLIVDAALTAPREDARPCAELAHAALTAALADPALEIRVHVAEALARFHEHRPELAFDPETVFEGVRRELAVDPTRWRALDDEPGGPQPAAPLARAISHLTTLLALAFPADPIRTAFHSLHGDDPTLRGVALEYLDNILPADIRERMWIVLGLEAPVSVEKRPLDELLAELLRPHGEGDDDDVHPALAVGLPTPRALVRDR